MDRSSMGSIASDPRFRHMVKYRLCLALGLSGMLVVLYVAYVLAMAYARSWMASTLFDDGYITVGLLFTIGFIIVGVVVSGVYTHWANTRFDSLKKNLLQRVETLQENADV